MIKRFLKSMGYAIDGIKLGVIEERNMRIDIVAMLFVWFHMQFFDITRAEKAIIVLVTFLVPAFELMNTAVERAVYKPDAAHWMPAGAAKDTAAGSVLIMTIGAVVIAFMLMGNIQGIKNVIGFYSNKLSNILLLFGYICMSYAFITIDNYKKRDK
ncbi:MAG: diacylglycerol kinase family protein [Oscillospiraceae bacterium]|nr:diacylglycerol kinase family protein [Oscillospiraceae bacterium]